MSPDQILNHPEILHSLEMLIAGVIRPHEFGERVLSLVKRGRSDLANASDEIGD